MDPYEQAGWHVDWLYGLNYRDVIRGSVTDSHPKTRNQITKFTRAAHNDYQGLKKLS